MKKYTDGFVLVVPKDKVDEYTKMATDARDTWMKYGALHYFECMGEDLAAQESGDQKTLSFTELAKANENETVWFSFIVYKSKEHRDEVRKLVMDEMTEKYKDFENTAMPFDMQRMATGGFNVEVEG